MDARSPRWRRAGGARGRIIDVTAPTPSSVYGDYGQSFSTDIVINRGGGSFSGIERGGVIADPDSARSDYSAGPPNSTVAAPSGGVTWFGLSGNDTVTDSARRDYLYSGEGRDIIITGDGSDVAIGGSGADTLDGNGGADDGELVSCDPR